MLIEIILYAGFAGITIIVGGLLALSFKHHFQESPVRYEITHTLMSLGAGILLSGLALVLIPKGMEELGIFPISVSFLAGTFTFMLIDKYLSKKSGETASVLALTMNYSSEAIALGTVFAIDYNMAALLAVFIGLQNVPEAFNAFRELVHSGSTVKKALTTLFFLSFMGIIGALLGHYLLSDYPKLTAALMTFASGGILYLLIQDIIPKSKLEKHYLTSTGASIGFLLGIVISKMV